jgi:hypothetical protein
MDFAISAADALERIAGAVDQSRTLRRHNHVAGVKIGIAQHVIGREVLDQREDVGGDALWKHAAAEPQSGVHRLAQRERVLRRSRLVNGKAERRKDCARLFTRDAAGARSLRQGRPMEPRQHDAKAAVQGDFADHLRRWSAGGEDRAGHLRLVLDDPPWIPKVDDLTGRPAVDISEDAFADLLC